MRYLTWKQSVLNPQWKPPATLIWWTVAAYFRMDWLNDGHKFSALWIIPWNRAQQVHWYLGLGNGICRVRSTLQRSSTRRAPKRPLKEVTLIMPKILWVGVCKFFNLKRCWQWFQGEPHLTPFSHALAVCLRRSHTRRSSQRELSFLD